MVPYDRPVGRPEQRGHDSRSTAHPGQGGPAQAAGYVGGTRRPVSEMSVATPTLRWVSIGHPSEQVPIGPDDYVLDSLYNYQIDAWEVLVIVQPDDADDRDEGGGDDGSEGEEASEGEE